MALVQFGGGVTQMAGSIAGNTFQRNIAGNIARYRRNPAVPVSTATHKTLVTTASLLSLFRNLGEIHHEQWIDYAHNYKRKNKYGVDKHQSALSFFLAINSQSKLVGGPIIYLPPVYNLPDGVESFEAGGDAGDIIIFFQPSPVPDGVAFVLYTTPPLLTYSTSYRSKLKLTKILQPGTTTYTSIKNDYLRIHRCPALLRSKKPSWFGCGIYAVSLTSYLISPYYYFTAMIDLGP